MTAGSEDESAEDSLRSGSNLTLGSLHTLTGVGHWVVQQIRGQLDAGGGEGGAPPPKRQRASEPAPTPQSFQWWYLDDKGKGVQERNAAQSSGPLGGEQFRVSSGHPARQRAHGEGVAAGGEGAAPRARARRARRALTARAGLTAGGPLGALGQTPRQHRKRRLPSGRRSERRHSDSCGRESPIRSLFGLPCSD
ncbi:unnamed protein product [Prorocentrum cordatum]|uniref:Uncharacterized protein n=1 Tax=Prorocentrum cordatum TaxID=2364126 RepID=A0ABN9PN82_9DINO|nr:unnamed protein product [Polarella glacialis]